MVKKVVFNSSPAKHQVSLYKLMLIEKILTGSTESYDWEFLLKFGRVFDQLQSLLKPGACYAPG
jgi:hypothetical protein